MDPFTTFNAGQPLRISAELHRILVRMAQWWLTQQRSQQKATRSGLPVEGKLRIKNISGAVRGQFNIVRLGNRIIGPSGADSSAFGDKVYESAAPLSDKPFAILQEPAGEESLAPAIMADLTWARILLTDATHGYALPIDDDYEKLESSADPTACEILAADSGATTQLAGGISDTDLTLTVDSSATFPAPPFVITIGTEKLNVTAVTDETWTVERGHDGTTPASHTDASTLTLGSGIVWALVRLIGAATGSAAKIGPQLRITDGVLTDGTFACKLLDIDPITNVRTVGDDILGVDLSNALELTAGDDYLCHELGNGPSGNYKISIVGGNTGNALTDNTKWRAVVGGITPDAWAAGTFPAGTLKTHSGDTWLADVETSEEPGIGAEWLIIASGVSDGGTYDSGTTYEVGAYVQTLIGKYDFNSADAGGCCPSDMETWDAGAFGHGPTFTTACPVTIFVELQAKGGNPGSGGGLLGGGGGGAYAGSILDLEPGSYSILQSDGNLRFMDSDAVTELVKAEEGQDGSGSTGGAGGDAANCIGDYKRSGGDGETATTVDGAGGGAGGFEGDGEDAPNNAVPGEGGISYSVYLTDPIGLVVIAQTGMDTPPPIGVLTDVVGGGRSTDPHNTHSVARVRVCSPLDTVPMAWHKFNRVNVTSNDSSVTIDTTIPGTFDLSVAGGGGGVASINTDTTAAQLITSADFSVTIDNSTPGTTDLSVAAGVASINADTTADQLITSSDGSVSIDNSTPGTTDLTVSALTASYVPGNSGDWGGDPISVQEALDRQAAAIAGLLAGPIP